MITRTRRNYGSGGIWRLTAPKGMAEELEVEAKELKDSLDPWSSPSIYNRGEDGEQLFIEVKYYGMD